MMVMMMRSKQVLYKVIWLTYAVPFSHMVPSYPERQVHWFGRAHLMKLKTRTLDWKNNNFVLDVPEGSGSRKGEKV